MAPTDTHRFTCAAPDLPALFEYVILHLFPATPDETAAEPFIVGFAASAPDLAALLEACVAEIAALADEHDAVVRDCAVSGVMPTDEGYRAWGFITFAPGEDGPSPVATIGSVAVEQLASGRWQASLLAGVTEGAT